LASGKGGAAGTPPAAGRDWNRLGGGRAGASDGAGLARQARRWGRQQVGGRRGRAGGGGGRR